MYLVVNVENLKLDESPMIMAKDESVQVPIVDDFSLEYLEFQEYVILYKRIGSSQQGDVEFLELVLKGYIQVNQIQ